MDYFASPLKTIWQMITSLSNKVNDVAPPNVDQLHIGKDLAQKVYEQILNIHNESLESSKENLISTVHQLSDEFVATRIPLPIFILNK